MVVSVLLVVGSYLLGTFPSAHLVAGRKGLDPTTAGSGNPGATNVYRVAGRRSGLVVFAADLGKGILAAGAGLAVDGRPLATACWVAATIGHMAPITRRLRGGKGVATAGGGSWVLFPVAAAVCMVVFVVVARLTGRASLGSLVIAALLPVIAGVWLDATTAELLAAIGLSVVVVGRHYENIRRLLSGAEGSWAGG